MTHKTLSKAELASRRQAVASYYLMRVDQNKIAELLGISQPTVSRDINFLIKEWKEESKAVIDDIIARESAELNNMEMEAANNYNKAKGRKPKYEDDPGTPSDPQQMERWMNVRLKIKERRAKMLGLDRPQKVELDANMKHSTANYAEMTDDELQQALKDELSKLATKGNSSGTDSN